MNSRELAVKLAEQHPKLFAKTNFERSDVQPGWFNIVDRLCADIEAEIASYDDSQEFWITEVNEKFAALRVHVSGNDRNCVLAKRIDELIAAASAQCRSTCQ